jgi:hypothetical protein
MQPKPTPTGSGSVASERSGDAMRLGREIAGGPDSTELVLINSVDADFARLVRSCRLAGAIFLVIGAPLAIFDLVTGGLR